MDPEKSRRAIEVIDQVRNLQASTSRPLARLRGDDNVVIVEERFDDGVGPQQDVERRN